MLSGAARERSSALRHWLPASPRVTRSAPMAWALRARAPVAAGSLPRATRSAPKAGALRARAPTCAPRVTAHVVSWGEWGCRRRRVLPAAREARCKACFELLPRERVGWHTATTSCCHRLRHARAERRYGGSWQEGGARAASPPLKVSRRRSAGHAPPARRGRRVRVPRAFKRPAKTLWWCGGGGVVVRTGTPNYLRLAPPDRGKFLLTTYLVLRLENRVGFYALSS